MDHIFNSTPSSELVASVRAGDLPAFAVLYDRYGRLVRAVCYDRLNNQADAEDLAQEVFLKAFRKIEQLRQPDRFGYWLVEIARSLAKDWLRQNVAGNRPTMEPFFDQHAVEIDKTMLSQLDEMHQAIAQLPERERIAIHIFYLAEQPASIAQDVLDLSSSGFYKLLDRARQKIAAGMSSQQGAQQ
jgi:RNA polymerase sigma-70 factor (ECF subfamily)